MGSIVRGSFGHAVIMIFVFATPAVAADGITPFKGMPIVEDVDSFWVEGAHIRLQGVDGPEVSGWSAAASNAATRYLYELTRGKELVCVPDGEMTRGRFAAKCRLPDGRDFGDAIVRAGYARDCSFFLWWPLR
jgi:endonuclease YncB( thermonuclease family)